MTAWAITLSALGVLLQVTGLYLVVHEIKRDRDRAGDLFPTRRPVRARRPRRYPPRQSTRTGSALPSDRYSAPGQAQPSQARLVRAIGAAINNAAVDLLKVVDRDREAMKGELEEKIETGDALLREHLHYVLVGSVRERLWGVILLGVGIALAGLGAGLGAVS